MALTSKIAIIDDEARMTKSLEVLLADKGHDIKTFQSGEAALLYLKSNECDLALLDIMMPGMDGYQVLTHLNQLHSDLAVIIMTGQASIDSAIRALRGGAYDYLCKPFDYDELMRKVEHALNHLHLSREKAQIANRLQWTETRYQYLVENSPDIIFTLGPQDEFLFINEKIRNCSDFAGRDLLGKKFISFVQDQDVELLRHYFQEVRTGNITRDLVEIRLKCADCGHNGTPCSGSHPLLEMKAVAMPNGLPECKADSPIEIYGIIRDITERRRQEEQRRVLENQLRQAQKMEAIGTLAGGIAHDFNNLLMAIQGNISLLLMHCDSFHPYHERLKKIERHIENGSKLTAQLLGYARKGKYEVNPVDLNRTIEETAQAFGRMRKEIRFYFNLSPDLAAIEADSSQVVQILMNLFLNAADAMPGGGDITVTTSNVDHHHIRSPLYKPKPGRYVLLSIRDTGAGMDEETKERIFEPFFTTKEMGRGTGLGLASVYGIIKGHQGFIEVDSTPTGGTTFCIFMPASERAMENLIPSEAEAILTGHGTILIVDDEEGILEIGKSMLQSLGYQVLTAHNGTEALDLYAAHRNRIDLVLLDMIMPGMNGGKVFDRLKRMNPEVRVLLISGYSMESEAKDIIARGCSGFLQKPFKINELSRKLRDILAGPAATNGHPPLQAGTL